MRFGGFDGIFDDFLFCLVCFTLGNGDGATEGEDEEDEEDTSSSSFQEGSGFFGGIEMGARKRGFRPRFNESGDGVASAFESWSTSSLSTSLEL